MNRTVSTAEFGAAWIWVTMEVLLCVTIVCGNSMTILAVWRFSRLQTVTNKFVASLAGTDLIVGLLIPYYIAFQVKPLLMKNIYLCITKYMFFVASNAASLTSLLMVSLDRYIAVVYPLHYHTYLSPRKTKAMLCTVVFNGIALGVFTVVAGTTSTNLKEGRPCIYATDVFDLVGIIGLCSAGFGFILIVIFMYSRIFWEARKQRRTIQVQENHRGTSMNTKSENKTAVTLAIVVGLFCACWFPINVVFLMLGLGIYKPVDETIYQVCLFVAITNSALNTFIYGWRNRGFRQAYRKILHCKTTGSTQDINESFTAWQTPINEQVR